MGYQGCANERSEKAYGANNADFLHLVLHDNGVKFSPCEEGQQD
jgi:hypothetical protein